MIKAVIYDMDGVIIDSEPFWHRAEIKAFSETGLKLTDDMCLQTTGLRVDEVTEYWYKRFPWENKPKKEIANDILLNVIQLVKNEGTAREGIYDSLKFFRNKNVLLALASSSAMDLISAVLKKLNLLDYFKIIHSAQFEEYGKPHPGVYLSTAKKLNINPEDCLSIEDSINGIIAAKAAKMKCIAIPEKNLTGDKRLGIADITLSSLKEINQEIWDTLNNH